jgi:hypothetical protein
MAETAAKPATYADIEALPEHLVGEMLFGHLITQLRPTRHDGGATIALGGPFRFGSGEPGGSIFVDEPELHLDPHVVVPDIAGRRRELMTEPAERAWLEVAPDWVCESLSPSTERYDKGDKRRIYAAYGVEHLRFIEPRERSLEVFRRQERDWLLSHTFFDEEPVRAPPFAEIELSLGLLWPFDPSSGTTPTTST